MTRKIATLRSETDLVRYLRTYPSEIALGDETPGDVFDRYHTEDYVMVSDGLSLDRQRMIDHAAPARKRVRSVTVEVHDTVVAGDQVAARYVLIAEMRKGGRIVTDIHMFGQLAKDGRLRRAEQLTRTLPPEPTGN